MHVRYFDAFPKRANTHTAALGVTGGIGCAPEQPVATIIRTGMRTVSLLGVLVMTWLITTNYMGAHEDYKFSVDKSLADQFQVNIDLTVGSPCDYLEIYVLDRTEDHMAVGHMLPTQTLTFGDNAQQWCRIGGSFHTNRVQGRLVIAAAMGALLQTGDAQVNMTHSISELSFGEYYPGAQDPLDFTMQIANADNRMAKFGYFLNVVPTTFHALGLAVDTFQYTVARTPTELISTAGPGIFFEWDFDPVKLDIYDIRMGFVEWVVKCVNVLSGLFVVATWLLSRSS